jgi:hypothetical protein
MKHYQKRTSHLDNREMLKQDGKAAGSARTMKWGTGAAMWCWWSHLVFAVPCRSYLQHPTPTR